MKKLWILLIIIGVLIMFKPINSIIKDSIGNIIYRGNVVTGIVATDNGDKSYDVFISESEKAYPHIFTLSANPNLAVGDKVRILYKNGCKELPIILPPTIAIPAITGEWVSPTGYIDALYDASKGWFNPTRIYDENLENYSAYNVSKLSWTHFIELIHEAMLCNKVRLYVGYLLGNIDKIDIDAYYDGVWHDVYEGDYAHECDETGNPLEWYEKSLDSIQTITEFRFRFYNSHPSNAYGIGIYEVDFFKVDE